MAIVSPLDLKYWFVDMFAGDSRIFVAISVMIIMGAAAYFRMPNIVAVMGVFLFAIFLLPYGITEVLVIVIIVILAIGIATLLNKFIR